MKKHLIVTFFLVIVFWTSFLSASRVLAAPVTYEAENGILNGTAVATSLAGYSGTGYVNGFDTTGDSASVSINISTAGLYRITLRFAAPWGAKYNKFYVDSQFQSSVYFPSSSSFTSLSIGSTWLDEGTHILEIRSDWGWIYLDNFAVEADNRPPLTTSKTPVNPNASVATKNLMCYLADHYGKDIIAGQSGSSQSAWIQTNTGKLPALNGFDMEYYSSIPIQEGITTSSDTSDAINWGQQGGIVEFQWHWISPSGLYDTSGCEWWRGFYTECTSFDIQYAMSHPGSTDYNLIIHDLDLIANQLKKLRDAGVTVLWRPLHEAEGSWFWWGAKGAMPLKQLYWLMYDRFTNYHGLNNLIWVWTTTNSTNALNWYPGDAYVDIVGNDNYASNGDYGPSTLLFYQLVDLYASKKMVAMTENGPIPDPTLLKQQKAGWRWFNTWYDFVSDGTTNSVSHVKDVYSNDYVITKDKLPNLNIYNCQISTKPGDFNGDGRVDVLDLRQLLTSFSGIFDYNLVVGNFGK